LIVVSASGLKSAREFITKKRRTRRFSLDALRVLRGETISLNLMPMTEATIKAEFRDRVEGAKSVLNQSRQDSDLSESFLA
jgi:hypothetical protein